MSRAIREGHEVKKNNGALGCRAAIGLILIGVGVVTGLFGWLTSLDVLRRDPQGMMLVAAVLFLVGLGVFLSVAFRGGGKKN